MGSNFASVLACGGCIEYDFVQEARILAVLMPDSSAPSM